MTCRIVSTMKALREAAAREHRSLANMLEVLVRRYAAESLAGSGRVSPPAPSRLRD